MSFSASTCITNTGTTELGPTLFFYSDVTGFGTSFGSDLTENLIGDNCPYIMENIPDGTTIVRIIDPLTNCGVDIVLQSSDLCNICNLNFDVYETQTVSQIVAGNLVGSCDDNISDYIINWYGPGEGSTNLAFTSGYGTEFADIGWNNTHPLTGSSSPLIQAGVYTPVIDRVIVNDVAYSTTGAPGTYVANLNCFNSSQVTVDALRCDNGNNVGDYSHHYLFNNVSVGVPPDSLSASFLLSANTNYLAWKFKGFQVYDTLKLTFYGSEYDNIPLIIENVRIGTNAGTSNVGINTNPKIINKNSMINKVTCLTGLTISEGDYITIEITPNQTNFNTIWDFYFTCLENFNCLTCYDQFQNSSPKIDLSSIELNFLPCDKVEISMQISGCSSDQLINTDIGKYFYNGQTPNTFWTAFEAIFNQGTYTFNNETCDENLCLWVGNICGPSGGVYSFTKSIVNGEGFINFSFNLFSDFQYYYNSYLQVINCLGDIVTDNTQLGYYKYFKLFVPISSNPNAQCGDTTQFYEYTIHRSSIVTTGGTGPWTMTLTMPTVVYNMTFGNCQGCASDLQLDVNNINLSSLSSSGNLSFTTNTGSKSNFPFKKGKYYTLVNYPATTSIWSDFISNWQFQNETYIYSGNNVLISTTQVCPYKGKYVTGTNYALGGYGYLQYSAAWKLELTNVNNVGDFQVLVAPISNWIPSGIGNDFNYTVTALTYTNGSITYSNPDYTF